MTRWGLIALRLAIAGCAWFAGPELDLRYGTPDSARYDRSPIGEPSDMPWHDVKGVLDNRCVVLLGVFGRQDASVL
jgi:hypothetical protein